MAVRGLYDVIVVGAGVEGSSTAYHSVKQGAERVLLLEQVPIQVAILAELCWVDPCTLNWICARKIY